MMGGHKSGLFPPAREVTEADIEAAAGFLAALTTSNDLNLEGIGVKTGVVPGHATSTPGGTSFDYGRRATMAG